MDKVKCFKCCKSEKCSKKKKRSASYSFPPKPDEFSSDDVDGRAGLNKKEEDEEEDILIIRKIDPCISLNGSLHHTEKYELMSREYDPQLVIRRGQIFRLILWTSRPYNPETDGISFIFRVDGEEKHSYGAGTLVPIPLMNNLDKNLPWNAVLEHVNDNKMTISILTDPNAVVAIWKLEIDTKIIDNSSYCYSWDTEIYLLFNPWCKQDQVYFKSEEWKKEGVLNDVGVIWRGTANRTRPVVWLYDQFEKNVLECAMYLVSDIGKIKGNAKSDAVKVVRALSAAVNAADDFGVVMGNWTEDHSGGTPPTKWLGSKEILQKYYRKKKPVKYGQCWVFSGVLTTICRTLGIPARTITNYSSGHDTQGSLTIDYFLDEEGKILEEHLADSIWNFHVWTEVWMDRPDLGSEYKGWQVIDSTPQELSEDQYRVGPSSVAAVKMGEVLRPYDNGFVFSEVNADKLYWRYAGPTQPLKLLGKDPHGVGKLILTKAANIYEPLNITHTYKYSEKSEEERSTMLRALRQSEHLFSRYYLNADFNDIYFEFVLKDDINIGQGFDVSLIMQNRTMEEEFNVNVTLRVEVVTYTGKVGEIVKKDHVTFNVLPNKTFETKMTVNYQDYALKLLDHCAFNISALAKVENTKFEYFAQDDFRVRKPDVKIILQDDPWAGNETSVNIFVENPLPVSLRQGEFYVKAPGLEKPLKLKVGKPVPPGENAVSEFKFTPPKSGKFTIAVKFYSNELDDCDGFLAIFVKESSVEELDNNV